MEQLPRAEVLLWVDGIVPDGFGGDFFAFGEEEVEDVDLLR